MKYKVLIVEDNDDINQLIYNLIKDEYDAVQAFSGTEALRIWNDRDTQPIDIILLDLMLPGKSGEEITASSRWRRCGSSCSARRSPGVYARWQDRPAYTRPDNRSQPHWQPRRRTLPSDLPPPQMERCPLIAWLRGLIRFLV